MIHSFRHKGLQRLFDDDDPRGVNQAHVAKLKSILATLDGADHQTYEPAELPAAPFERRIQRIWAVTVRANWRVIFRFDNGAHDMEYLDYH